MEFDITPTFPTFIGRFQIPDADAMNHELRGFILAKEAEYARLGHSNIGGGHSSPDVFHNSDPSVVALTTWVSWMLNQMIGATAGPEEIKGVLSLSAWRQCVAPVPTMRPTFTGIAHGPARITWMPAFIVRTGRSAVCTNFSISVPL